MNLELTFIFILTTFAPEKMMIQWVDQEEINRY